MKPPSKLLQFAQQQKSQSWLNFQILPPRPSVDPNFPPLYLVDIQGMRGDGIAFKVTVTIDKQKYDLLTAKDALNIAQQLLNNGIKQLMTFTGCPCTVDEECEQHKRTLH